MLIALAAALAFGGEPTSILVDFGSPGRKTKGHWNNATKPGDEGLLLESAIDAQGRATSLALRQRDGWAGADSNGHGGEGPFPPSAMGDSFYLETGVDTRAAIAIEGLTPGGKYTLTLFASRMGGTQLRTGRYAVGEKQVELNAADNTDKSISIENIRPDDRGVVSLAIDCPDGQEYAYLGVLKIDGTFGEPREHKLPPDALDGPPLVTAKAWAIGDGRTGELLWSDNETATRHMASTTKIMTAWIVLELARKQPKVLDEVVTISEKADKTGGSSARVQAGEKLPVRDLLYGLLLPSGNDAAVALAEHFGDRFEAAAEETAEGGNGNGNGEPPRRDTDEATARFVAEMNRRAAELGMNNTHYHDPHGNSANRSSAGDLLRLALAVMKNELLRDYVGTRTHRCTLTGEDGATREATWKNTNKLLEIEGFDGIKTGTTGGAGACLVSRGRRGDDRLIVVVLGSVKGARYIDTRNLYRWAWRQRMQ